MIKLQGVALGYLVCWGCCQWWCCQGFVLVAVMCNVREGGQCRWWSESTHATNPKPTTAQKPWSRTKIEAELCVSGPPNDQTRTVMMKLLIKLFKKIKPLLPQWKAAPLVGGSTTVTHTGVLNSCHIPKSKSSHFLCLLTTLVERGGSVQFFTKR